MTPESSLARTFVDARSLVVKEGTLTAEQYKQLGRSTQLYLRDNGLLPSIQNIKSVSQVVCTCAAEGVRLLNQHDAILRSDNMFTAFQRGYAVRQELLAITRKELDGLTGAYLYEGELALDQNLVSSTLSELSRAVTAVDLPSSKRLALEVAKRRPAYRQLLAFCRDQVEQLFPGSKEVKLTRQQEVGLVRNLIFSWVTYGKPQVLLETEEFMVDKSAFVDAANKGQSLRDLADAAGLDWTQYQLYLLQLAEQIRVGLASVPQAVPGITLETMAKAYQQLDKLFLVTSPFQKLAELSRDPKDKGRSIWDSERSIVVNVEGVAYRIPSPRTIEILAYRESGEYSQGSGELKKAALRVGQLQGELQRQQADLTIVHKESELAAKEEAYTRLVGKLRRNEIPADALLPKSQILEYAQRQALVIGDELQIFDLIRNYSGDLFNRALYLLGKYDRGAPLDSIDNLAMISLMETAEVISWRLKHFLDDSIKSRVNNLMRLQASKTVLGSLASQADHRYSFTYFDDALQTTIIDVLAIRSTIFMNNFLASHSSQAQQKRIWRAIIRDETSRFDQALGKDSVIAWQLVSKDKEFTKKDQDRFMAERRARITSDPYHSLGRWWAKIYGWKEAVLRGACPALPPLNPWEASIIERAISTWTPTVSYSSPINSDSPHYSKIGEEGKVPAILASPFGPARVLIRVIGRLAPEQLRPHDPPSLYDNVTHELPEEYMETWVRYSRDQDAEKARQAANRSKLISFLGEHGFEWDEVLARRIIPMHSVSELIRHSALAARFFGVEAEIRNWLSSLAVKLDDQRSQEHSILQRTPAAYLRGYKADLEAMQREIEAIKRQRRRDIESRLNQLRHLGLVLPESQFGSEV